MSEILWPLAVVAVVAAFGGLVGGGVVLSLRRRAARADEDWRRWSAEHGWHHVATSRDVLRPPAVRSPTPAQQRGLVARDLTRAVGDHVVRAAEVHRRVRVHSGGDPAWVLLETALVEIDGLPVDAPTLVLRPRGWPRTAWEDQLGTLPEVDAGGLAEEYTATSRDARFAAALLGAPLERLAAGPKPPGTVVVDGRHLLVVWDGPLTEKTLVSATAFLTALVTALPGDLPAAARRRPAEPRLSGIARYLADTAGSAHVEERWDVVRAGRELAGADPLAGRRPRA
jgi:hypothetical protein